MTGCYPLGRRRWRLPLLPRFRPSSSRRLTAATALRRSASSDMAQRLGVGSAIQLVPALDDPKDLFGTLATPAAPGPA